MSSPSPALLAAIRSQDVAQVSALLEEGPPSPDLVAAATSAKAHAVLALLIERGAPVDASAGEVGPLHKVADAKAVQTLVAAGADVNRPGPAGLTPLHMAASNADPPVIKALLAAGADPQALDGRGQIPLQVAAELGRTAAVKALLARPPADPLPWNLLASFSQRSGKKEQGVLATLLTVLPPDAPPMPGFGYALHIAARAGIAASVQALLAAGADKNRLDFEGFTAAHRAIEAALGGFDPRPGQVAAYQALVEAGADVDIVCGGTTARALALKLSPTRKK